MFGLTKQWESVAQLAATVGRLAGTIDAAACELQARLSLPPVAEAPALPPPAPTNGDGAGPAEARKPRQRKAV
jgi:hypothetical protein